MLPARRAAIVALCLLAPVLLAAGAAQAEGPSRPGIPLPAAGPSVRPAADAAGLAAEIGQGRPAVLHFWATWCTACAGEFGRLRGLFASLPGRGVAVALVSIDSAETRGRVPSELRRFGVSGLPSLVLDAPDPAPVAAALGEPRWDGTLPATFVFDARGKKVASFLGTTTRARLERAVRAAAADAMPGAAMPGAGAPSAAAPPPAQPKG